MSDKSSLASKGGRSTGNPVIHDASPIVSLRPLPGESNDCWWGWWKKTTGRIVGKRAWVSTPECVQMKKPKSRPSEDLSLTPIDKGKLTALKDTTWLRAEFTFHESSVSILKWYEWMIHQLVKQKLDQSGLYFKTGHYIHVNAKLRRKQEALLTCSFRKSLNIYAAKWLNNRVYYFHSILYLVVITVVTLLWMIFYKSFSTSMAGKYWNIQFTRQENY